MATYTVVTTRALTGGSTYVIDYADDDSVVADAKQVLDDVVISVAIARGAVATKLYWLGEWRLFEGEPQWRTCGLTEYSRTPGRRGLRLVHRSLG